MKFYYSGEILMKIYTSNNREYTYKDCKFYIDAGSIVIEDNSGYSEYVDELPITLISKPVVRKAIYLAYKNFGDTYVGTICNILKEQASLDDLNSIENEFNKCGDSIYNY